MVYKYKGRKIDFDLKTRNCGPRKRFTYIPTFCINILNGTPSEYDKAFINDQGMAKCGDHIYLIKSKKHKHFPVFTKREQKEAKKMIRQHYEVTKSTRTAYKMMYLRSVTIDGKFDDSVFIPALVKVEIPKNHIVYHGMSNKCRTDYGIIKEVCDIREIIAIAGYVRNNLYNIDLPMVLLNKINRSNYNDRKCVTYISQMNVDFSNKEIGIYDTEREINQVVELDTKHVYSMYEVGNLVAKYIRTIKMADPFPISKHIYKKLRFDISSKRRSIGDVIKIDDFNFEPLTCASGFHFFESKEDAVDYIRYL